MHCIIPNVASMVVHVDGMGRRHGKALIGMPGNEVPIVVQGAKEGAYPGTRQTSERSNGKRKEKGGMCMTSAACRIGARCTRLQRQLRRSACTPYATQTATPPRCPSDWCAHARTAAARPRTREGRKDAHSESDSASQPPRTREHARPHLKLYPAGGDVRIRSLHP
jgi:hypothetical protein